MSASSLLPHLAWALVACSSLIRWVFSVFGHLMGLLLLKVHLLYSLLQIFLAKSGQVRYRAEYQLLVGFAVAVYRSSDTWVLGW
jgi:hypothetical protein